MLKGPMNGLVVAVAVLGGVCGCTNSTVSNGSTNSTPSTANSSSVRPPTTLEPVSGSGSYEVNGRTLTLDCGGTGTPTVVLEGGTDAPTDAMAALQARLATQFVTCTYQRARVAAARTLGDANKDLHDLLAAAHVPGPLVIVGQSIGGDLAQLYARTYSDQVVAVVSINSGPPCPPWLAALPKLGNENLLSDEEANCADTGGRRDRFDLNASYSEDQAAPAPPDIPFELIISTADTDWCPPSENPPGPFASQEQCHAAYAIHERLAREIVARWPQGNFNQIDAPHEVYATQLDAIVQTVQSAIARAK